MKKQDKKRYNGYNARIEELFCIKNLCLHSNMKFDYEDFLCECKSHVSAEDFEIHSKKGRKFAEHILKENLSIFSIGWSGKNIGIDIEADITINLTKKFSLKGSKSYTKKNIGLESFSNVIKLDLKYKTQEMCEKNVCDVNEKFNLSINVKELKKTAKANEIINKFCKNNGRLFVGDVKKEIVNHLKDKTEIINNLLDVATGRKQENLFVLVDNKNTINEYSPYEKYNNYQNNFVIEETKCGFKIKFGEEFIRFNVCCTNGLGISALCVRCF